MISYEPADGDQFASGSNIRRFVAFLSRVYPHSGANATCGNGLYRTREAVLIYLEGGPSAKAIGVFALHQTLVGLAMQSRGDVSGWDPMSNIREEDQWQLLGRSRTAWQAKSLSKMPALIAVR